MTRTLCENPSAHVQNESPAVGCPLDAGTAPGARGRTSRPPRGRPGETPGATIPRTGDEVSYRCAALGQFYSATVIAVRRDGTLDIDVHGNPPLHLTKRPWHAGNPLACPRRSCTAAGLRGSI